MADTQLFRFLWVALQLDFICDQNSDNDILEVLDSLPLDLAETYDRLLRKISFKPAHVSTCNRIFRLINSAQRPLTLDELREAISVEPGVTRWEPNREIKSVLKALKCAGSLITIDEEDLTVHFLHSSARQHLLGTASAADLKDFHFNVRESERWMAGTVVTYLNYKGKFDQRVAGTEQPAENQKLNYTTGILNETLGQSNPAKKLALKYLKSRGDSRFDVKRQLIDYHHNYNHERGRQELNPFLGYARATWLIHSKMFEGVGRQQNDVIDCFAALVASNVGIVEVPWFPELARDKGPSFLDWIADNCHWPLLKQVLEDLIWEGDLKKIRFILYGTSDWRIRDALLDEAEKLFRLVEECLYLAVRQGNAQIVSGFVLDDRTFWWKSDNEDESLLQLAAQNGSKDIIQLCLGHGAELDVCYPTSPNTELELACSAGHEKLVKYLLGLGANVNHQPNFEWTPIFSSPLMAAATYGHDNILKILVSHGANVSATIPRGFDDPLQAADSRSQTKTVDLLLSMGAKDTRAKRVELPIQPIPQGFPIMNNGIGDFSKEDEQDYGEPPPIPNPY